MYRRNNRLISMMLIFCFTFASMVYMLPVYAVDTELESGLIEEIAPNGGFSVGDKLALKQSDVPEVMSLSDAQSKGHVYRLRNRENDMNTTVFLNDDNTETMYVYAEPIKYVDSNGNVKDKSTALTASGNDLVMADNDITVKFPQSINQGITVSKDDKKISMMPQAVTTSTRSTPQNSKSGKNSKAIYSDAFGDGIHLEYTALFSGVKEDIILESYTGKTEFSFIINTNGLYPVKNENGSVSFYDPSTDDIVADMMQVYCIDAANNFAGGDINITEMKQNQKYIFTVIPDAEFLTSATTVYPVTIDPTITMNGDDTVEDAVIYSGKPTHNYGDHRYATIGYLDDTYQKGEYLVKFPSLASDASFTNFITSSSDILSARYTFYTASGSSGTTTIKAYALQHKSWTESAVTWNSIYPMMIVPSLISTTSVPSSGTQKMTINVLSAARGWKNGTYDPAKGLILCNTNETDATVARDFLTTEYAISTNSTYMPRLEINYASDFTIISEEPNPLTVDIEEESILLDINVVFPDGSFTYWFDTYTITTGSDVVSVDEYGEVYLLGIGYATIVMTYSSGNHSESYTQHIQVVDNASRSITVASIHTMNSDNVNRNGTVTYDINAKLKVNGVNQAADVDLEYTLINNANLNAGISSSTGVITLTVDDPSSVLQHPEGILQVKVTFKKNNNISKTLLVDVRCQTDLPLTSGTDSVPLVDGRYIRINYPTNENEDKCTYIGSTGLFSEMLQSIYGQDSSFESINTDFTLEDGWWQYDKRSTNQWNRRFFELIRTSKVVFVSTHGGITDDHGVLSINSADTEDYLITTEDILELHKGYFNYCQLIVVIACDGATVAGDGYSICSAFTERGAQCVIGFNDIMSVSDIKKFENQFFKEMKDGTTTISDAAAAAAAKMEKDYAIQIPDSADTLLKP